MCGHQADGVGAHGAPGEGVGRDVLGVDLFQEVQSAPAAGALLRAGGRREQRAYGVQVAVGVASGRAAAPRGAFQAGGPGCAVPQVPQRLLGAAARGEASACLAEQGTEPLGAARVGGVVHGEPLRLGQCPGEQFVRGRRQRVAGGPLLLAQGAAEAAQVRGVHAGEGRGEQGEGGLGGEPAGIVRAGRASTARGLPLRVGVGDIGVRRGFGLGGRGGGLGIGAGVGIGRTRVVGVLRPRVPVGVTRARGPVGRRVPRPARVRSGLVARARFCLRHGPQRRQQGRHSGFVAQREVVAVDVQGDAGRGEGAAERGDGARTGAHQDGHVPPRDAVLQVRAAQDVGDVVQLGAGGRVRVRLDAPAVPLGGQLAVGADLVGGKAGQRHALGEQPGGGQEAGPGPA